MKNKTVLLGIQMNWLAVLAGVFSLTMAVGVSAAQNARPCADDAAKLCKGVQGNKQVAQCLKEHSNDLSPACKENIDKVKEKVQNFKQACKDDAAKLCKGTKPGGGKIVQCLQQHEDQLSAACKEAMPQPKGKM